MCCKNDDCKWKSLCVLDCFCDQGLGSLLRRVRPSDPSAEPQRGASAECVRQVTCAFHFDLSCFFLLKFN